MRKKSSRFVGVSFDTRRGLWKADVYLRVTRCLGRFEEEEAAARAHDNARSFLDRYFAKSWKPEDINFPDELEYAAPLPATIDLEKQLDQEMAPKYRHLSFSPPEGNSEASRAHLVME